MDEKLLAYIQEQEAKEKNRRRFWLIGGLSGATLLIAGVLFWVFRDDRNPRMYEADDLSLSKVMVLFEASQEPVLVRDPEQGRIDTLRSVEDYPLLLAAIEDSEGTIRTQEQAGKQGGDFDVRVLEAARSRSQHEKLRVDQPLERADVMPSFPGGESSLYQFLSRQLRYPPQAMEAGVEGKVYVRFVVHEDGSIDGIEVMRGIGHGCDEEATRVVRQMPRWLPGQVAGQPVPVFASLAVNFKFL
jgi:TonB family protein